VAIVNGLGMKRCILRRPLMCGDLFNEGVPKFLRLNNPTGVAAEAGHLSG